MSGHSEGLQPTEVFLEHLYARGIKIALGSNDTLQYAGPRGAVTDEIVTALKSNKVAILSHLRSRQSRARQPLKPTIPRASYELSPAQMRLWVLSHFDQASLAYNVPGVYEISGPLNLAALKTAFAELLKRHESLR